MAIIAFLPAQTPVRVPSPLPSYPMNSTAHTVRTLAGTLCLLGAASTGLAQTTYTEGFRNLPRSEAPGTLLSHPADNGSLGLGRTSTVQYINGWIVAGGQGGGDNLVRVYDISDPENLVRMYPSDFGHPTGSGTLYAGNEWQQGIIGFNAHGTAIVNDNLIPTAFHVDGYGGRFEKNVKSTNYRNGGNRSGMAGPWSSTFVWYSSQNDLFTIQGAFYRDGVWHNRTLATFDHQGEFGSSEWHPMFFGDLLIYASGGGVGRDGVVVYRLRYNDFDDLDQMSVTPQVVGVLDGEFKGYWPNLFSDGAGLYVVGSTTSLINVVEITDAVDPSGDGKVERVGELVKSGLSNATYPTYQDQYAFVHNIKVDMTRLIGGNGDPVVLELDQDANGVDTSQMSRPLGNLWVTGGKGGTTSAKPHGVAVWVQQQAPDTTPPRVTYHVPQAGRTNYPQHALLSFMLHETPYRGIENGRDFTVSKVLSDGTLAAPHDGFLIHDMSGALHFTGYTPLDANATYEVEFHSNPAEGIGFRDAAGNYIEPYSFRFATGSGFNGQEPPSINSVSASNFKPLPGQSFTASVSASGTSLQYRFNFDGNWTGWSNQSSRSHTYAAPGRYRVLVQVRDNQGGMASESLQILVITPPSGPSPTQSGTITRNGTRIAVVNPDANTIALLDANTGVLIGEYAAGTHPRNIATDASGRYWVTAQGSDEIYILNPNGSIYQILELGYGAAPFGVAASPNGQQMFVTLYGSAQLLRFTLGQEGNPLAIATPPTPRAIAVSGDGSRVFVTRFISTDKRGEVTEYASGSTLTQVRSITLRSSDVADTGDRGAGVPNYLSGIAISPDGQHAIVTAKQDNIFRGEAFGRPDLTFENTVRAIACVIDLTTNTEFFEGRRDFDNSESPSAVHFSPLGDVAFVTLQGNNRLFGFDATRLADPVDKTATARLDAPVGLAPQGLVLVPESQRIFVQNFMGRSVTVLDASAFLNENRTRLPLLRTTDTVANELLDPEVLLGKQIFYNASDSRMSMDSYISCASCHSDGGHDGRVWDFTGRGEGLRRTTDLRGRGGMDHGNVHWSGNFDEIHDFEHDIRGAFGGTGFIDLDPVTFAAQHPGPQSTKVGLSPELDALAAYVSSLKAGSVPKSPHREFEGTFTPEAMAGAQVFNSMNCASCHSGDAYTDSPLRDINNMQLRDVGTTAEFSGGRLGNVNGLTGIDTPTLWGLHDTHAYLHHGQVTSLAEVFTFAGGQVYHAIDAIASGNASTMQKPANPHGGGFRTRGMLGDEAIIIRGPTSTTPAGTLRFNGIDGGPQGGLARIAMRYSIGRDGTGVLRINGVNHTLQLPQTAVDNTGTNTWNWASLEVPLNPGTNNTIIIQDPSPPFTINVLQIAHHQVLAKADAHRQVMDLGVQERDSLMSYLRQLDGRDADGQVGGAPEIELLSPAAGTVFASTPASFNVRTNVNAPPGVGIEKIEFFLNGALRWTSTSPNTDGTYASWFGNIPAGMHSIRITATATNGISASTVTEVTVLNNQAPTATLLNPVEGQEFEAGEVVTLRATASDADGSIASVQFLLGWASQGAATRVGATDTYTLEWTVPATLGEYVMRVRAYDNEGALYQNEMATFTVIPPGNGDGDDGDDGDGGDGPGSSTVNLVDGSDLVLYLPFDTNADDALNNMSTSLLDGASIAPSSGQFDGALHLQGGTQRVTIANNTDLNTGSVLTQRTLSLWFAVDDATNPDRQMLFESGGGVRGFNLYVQDGTLYVGSWDTAIDAAIGDIGSWDGSWRQVSGIQANRWYHVALVLDASANPTSAQPGAFFAYLNGVEFDVANDIGMQVGTHTGGTVIGGNESTRFPVGTSGAVLNLSGYLDDFAIWNRALTAAEINALANGISGGVNLAAGQEGRWGENRHTWSQAAAMSTTNLTDGSLDTNAGTRPTSNLPYQWLGVDLGEPKTVSAVDLYWRDANHRAVDYEIETSSDAITWTSRLTVAGNTELTTSDSITPVSAQYIRVKVILGGFGESRDSMHNRVILEEMEVY